MLNSDKNLIEQHADEIITKFVETGSVLNAIHHPERRVRNQTVKIAVSEHVFEKKDSPTGIFLKSISFVCT